MPITIPGIDRVISIDETAVIAIIKDYLQTHGDHITENTVFTILGSQNKKLTGGMSIQVSTPTESNEGSAVPLIAPIDPEESVVAEVPAEPAPTPEDNNVFDDNGAGEDEEEYNPTS